MSYEDLATWLQALVEDNNSSAIDDMELLELWYKRHHEKPTSSREKFFGIRMKSLVYAVDVCCILFSNGPTRNIKGFGPIDLVKWTATWNAACDTVQIDESLDALQPLLVVTMQRLICTVIPSFLGCFGGKATVKTDTQIVRCRIPQSRENISSGLVLPDVPDRLQMTNQVLK